MEDSGFRRPDKEKKTFQNGEEHPFRMPAGAGSGGMFFCFRREETLLLPGVLSLHPDRFRSSVRSRYAIMMV